MTLAEIIKYVDKEVKSSGLEEAVKITNDKDRMLLEVEINKLGRSELVFNYARTSKGWTTLSLVSEDLAFLHRVNKKKAVSALDAIVTGLGGVCSAV